MTTSRSPLPRVLLLTVLASAAAACSLPVDERVTPIDRGEFGVQLTQDTTTTTTTTTTVPPTTSTPDDTTVSTDATTTTVTIVPTENITVFFARGSTDVMQPVDFPLAVRTPIEELVPLLERPTGISDAGLRTAVRPGLIERIGPVERGVATVSLDRTVLDRMSEPARQQAIAQIVLTVTSFRTADAGAIGRIRFEVDGDGLQVFVPAFGGQSEPGQELAFEDFLPLIGATPTPTTSSTTSTTIPALTDPARSEPTITPEPLDDGG